MLRAGTAELVRLLLPTFRFITLTTTQPSSQLEYRSAIFYNTPEQAEIARRVTAEVQAKRFDPQGKKIVTEITPASKWYDAEDYHQEYLFKNPSGYQCPTHRLNW
jgi:peptide-methionine (S)-S-oxide reductase